MELFHDRGETPLRKDSLSLSRTPPGENKKSKCSQVFVALFSILSCILDQEETLLKKQNTIQFRKSKNVYDSFLLLDITSHFNSENATSASALKDSLFISSSRKFSGAGGRGRRG